MSLPSVEMTRVLLIAPQPFFVARGTPMNVRAMAETLGKHGMLVDLLVFPLGEEVSLEGVVVHRSLRLPFISEVPPGPSWSKFLLDIPLFFHAFYLSVKRGYRVFHGVEEGSLMAGLLGLLFSRPYIFDMDSCMGTQLREGRFLRLLAPVVDAVEKFFLRRSAVTLTVCEALSEKVRSAVPGVAICQIEDFPLEGSADFSAERVEALREEFGLQNLRPVVYTGNFKSYQGMDLLLRSFALVKDTQARLLLVGSGEERAELETLCHQLGIAERVLFAGARPPEEMGDFMALADVLVSPRCEGENTPLKLYSYMAAGRPLVATNIRSHTQVLTDKTAFLAQACSEDFAAALSTALSYRAEATSKARRAQQLVEQSYSKAAFQKKLLGLYSEFQAPKNVEPPLMHKQGS